MMSGMSGSIEGKSPELTTEYQNQMSMGTPIAIAGYHMITGTARSLISSLHPYIRVAIRITALIRSGSIPGGIEKGSIKRV